MAIDTYQYKDHDFLIIKIMTPNLNTSNSSHLRLLLSDNIDQGHRNVVLDMTGVKSIDSSALYEIIAAVKRVGNLGAISVAQLTPKVEQVFKLTRMDKVVTVAETVDHAILGIAKASNDQSARQAWWRLIARPLASLSRPHANSPRDISTPYWPESSGLGRTQR